MTERKPAGMSWETWIDAQIRVAREQGAFDNLPGAGKAAFKPWSRPGLALVGEAAGPARANFHSASIARAAPQGGEGARRDRELGDEATVRDRVAALNVEIVKVNSTVLEGPPTRLSRLNVDKIVERWRRTRAANPRGIAPTSSPPQRDVER